MPLPSAKRRFTSLLQCQPSGFEGHIKETCLSLVCTDLPAVDSGAKSFTVADDRLKLDTASCALHVPKLKPDPD